MTTSTNTKTLALFPLVALLAACGPDTGRMLFLRHKGADMPIWVRGAADAPTLVLVVHGGPGETSFNLPESPGFAALEADTSVAYWDQRASGTSQGNAPESTLTVDQFQEDLDLAVNLLRQEYPEKKLVVLGYSWGGTLTSRWLGSDPTAQGRIAGWVAYSAASDIPLTVESSRSWATARIEERLAANDTSRDWQKLAQWYAAHPRFTATEYLQHTGVVSALEIDSPHSGINGHVIFESPYSFFALSANAHHVGPLMLAQIFDSNFAPGLANVHLPALVLSGAVDGHVPMPVGDELFDSLGTPAALKTRVVGAHSAHSMHLEEPELFSTSVRAFLSRL